jgi:hypothetical protein
MDAWETVVSFYSFHSFYLCHFSICYNTEIGGWSMHVTVTFPAAGLSINSVSIVTVGRVNALMPLASYT